MGYLEECGQVYTKMMYGEDVIRIPVQLIIQAQGPALLNGKDVNIYSMVGCTSGDAMSEFAKANNFPQELIIGELIIRPLNRYTGNNHIGEGLAGLATNGALFPDEWDYKDGEKQ